MKLFTVMAFLLITQITSAGDHSLTDIKGREIELKSYDHAIAGSIKDFVIFGNTDEDKNLSDLIIKKDGQLIRASFTKNGNILSGRVTHQVNGIQRETSVKFLGIDASQQKILLEVNGAPAEVLIKAEGFQNNHFINPHYYVTLSNARAFDFKIMSGGACYKASIHLAMMIVTSFIHFDN